MARIKRKGNFTTVLNVFIRDKNISFKAKGVFTYMASFADDWNFTLRSMSTQSKDGIAGIRAAVTELREHGYLDYQKNQDGSGVYTLYDAPQNNDRSQSSIIALCENRNVQKCDRIKKNNSTKKNNINKKNKELTFNDWLENLKQTKEKPIPENSAVFKYAEKAGISENHLYLCWQEFKDRYSESDKKYIDWRKVFNNCVRQNWFGLYWFDENRVSQLTTKGKQADNYHSTEIAR